MQQATIIFPHQLFKNHPALQTGRRVYLVEETLFFNQYNFHKQKLLLHRATMKAYADYLFAKHFEVVYIDAQDSASDVRALIAQLYHEHITTVHIAEVVDDWLNRRINSACHKNGVTVTQHRTPAFLNSMEDVKPFFDKKKTYFQTPFYTEQRKRRNILLNSEGGPEGGHWTFDADNRMRFPKNKQAPAIEFAEENNYVKEARQYVQEHFADNYGSVKEFLFPTTFGDAEKWLDAFLTNRFYDFGIYEDAIVEKEHFLHHAVISPLLNTGLLLPQQVIDKAISFANNNNVPLNSLEGFIRQVMGWREYIRIVYEREGRRQRTKNYWGFTRKIPEAFWKGTTGIVPVDSVITKVLKIGYSHHIERLMVMGNFMLLCEFDPDEVYRWFMEMYVDAYDWVMVPNVYGMTQFSDGGLMMTKPYISSSNYLLKMSDYKKGEWSAVWDGLFWRFMHVHRNFFLQNSRLSLLLNTFDKWPADKRKKHLDTAEAFLEKLNQDNIKSNYLHPILRSEI